MKSFFIANIFESGYNPPPMEQDKKDLQSEEQRILDTAREVLSGERSAVLRGCDKVFSAAVGEVVYIIKEAAEKMRLQILCKDLARSLLSKDRASFLAVCREMYRVAGSAWNEGASQAWENNLSKFFDRALRGEIAVNNREVFVPTGRGGNLVIYFLGEEKFLVNFECN